MLLLIVMRKDHALLVLRDGLGLLLLLFLISGCASFIAMETPQTLPEGEINLVFAGAKLEDNEFKKISGVGVFKARVGTNKPVDFGFRLDVLPHLSVMVDAKYQLLRTDKHGLDLAFLGGTGTPFFYFQAILGRQLGPFQIYSSYRYQFIGTTRSGTYGGIGDPEISIQQGFAGIRLDLKNVMFCQGEGGYMWEQDIYMIGVGCGIIFSAL